MTPTQTPDFLKRIQLDWEQVRPGLSTGPMLTVVLLERLHTALSQEVERTYLAVGLNAAGWDLLLTLYRSAPREGLTPTQLMELAAISGPSMTNRIERLVGKGLVERREDVRDRRSFQVCLTPEGRALVERLLPLHLANLTRILGTLTPEETQALHQLAARLLVGLETRASGEAG